MKAPTVRQRVRWGFIAAATMIAVPGASGAVAAPLVLVSGRVCDVAVAPAIRAPDPGEERCAVGDLGVPPVQVTARDRRGRMVAQTRARRNGTYRLRLPRGTYVLTVFGGSYGVTVRVGSVSIRNVDLRRGIIF